jgi:para-aminobenzoate synthetase component 1
MLDSDHKSYRIQTLDIPPETDISDVFEYYADQPWSMLLDSANSQHKNARFNIVVADPIARITAIGCECTIHYTSKNHEIRSGDPIAILRQLIKTELGNEAELGSLNLAQTSELLPFTYGAVGFFGYDLGRCFEHLPEHSKARYQTPDMAVGIYTWSVVKDTKTGLFYLCQLDGFAAPSETDILQQLEKSKFLDRTPFKLTSDWQSNMTHDQYMANLSRVNDYLHAGDCYQVNLAQRFHCHYDGCLWLAYLALRHANQAPFSAFIQLQDSAIISISPERFLSVRSNQVESQPIKGTRPRSLDQSQDALQIQALLQSDKDRAENLMIVDLLRNDMSKTCKDNSIHVPSLFAVESFAAVHHLVSTVTGTLREDQDALSLIRGAFPGGSITGAPKIRAMEIIDELEPDRRNIYCGSIGYININGDMDTNICIRTLLCEQNNLYCWAGGGIVLDSNAKDEYQESFDKVSKILPVLSQLSG